MKTKLDNGDAVDLSACKRLGRWYVLDAEQAQKTNAGLDFCDRKTEAWVWSIGRVREAGELRHTANGVTYVARAGMVIASLSAELYQCDGVECLWLR